MVAGASWRMRRNPDKYAVINYMACQDGFTLNDAVTYNYRHNEANHENNQDGSSYNYSWNCGVEGPSRKQNTPADEGQADPQCVSDDAVKPGRPHDLRRR